ncbi:MAG: hypothetical protein Q9195_006031 [Heterodermia aff. obscurata]
MANPIRGIVSANTNVAKISPALANLNFDFTLCRVEAPTEFHGVGRALTRGRRAEAESGQSHITARILGALFTSALPKTPNLSRVYGLRASEISKSATEEASETQSWGFFADHSGADGTTIWASATSGPESIPTHLLACLLARVWDPPEAISIWEEVVRRHIRDVWAAKHPLSREHLAEWDNSARSWLRTADRVKKREQKQVMLILDNIEQQIRSDQGTYESVLSTWREALTFFEPIVSGISQRAGNGQSLLALCAWHLYPELMVVDPSPRQTKQNDALMPAKVIVTIGLGEKSGQQDGVCWSLPLAYFRHYGPAVKRKSIVNSTQRLSVEEFEMAFFGTFIAGWTSRGVTVAQIAHWLRRFHQILLQKSGTESPAGKLLQACQRFSWLGILFDSSHRVRHDCHELEGGAVFEYLTAKPISRRCSKRDLDGSQLVISKHCRWMYKGGNLSKHTREKCYVMRLLKRYPELFDGIWQHFSPGFTGDGPSRPTSTDLIEKCFSRIDRDRSGWAEESRPCFESALNDAADSISLNFQQRQTTCNAMGEDVHLREDQVIEDYRSEELGVFWTTYSHPPLPSESCWYRQVYGSRSAALFVLESRLEEHIRVMKRISIPRLLGLFDTDLVDPDKLATLLVSSLDRNGHTKRVASLRAVSTAASIYSGLSNATIDVRVLQQDLSTMRWMAQARYPPSSFGLFLPATLDLPSIFSCICFFESGRFDIEISALQNVMAMSTGDNIWVAYPLLHDPYSTFRKFNADLTYDARRRVMDPGVIAFTGNVGRPGISFLVPPKEPMIRSSCIYDFRQIVHEPFDGYVGNSFHDTSLHLSFTSATSSISAYFEGLKDSELEVVETALSVYERDKWVADLDVLNSMKKPWQGTTIPPCSECRQKINREQEHNRFVGENENGPAVTAIVNWTELLNPPETTFSIVKAFGNWEARLAAYVISVASGYRVNVLPDIWCWDCINDCLVHNREFILIA